MGRRNARETSNEHVRNQNVSLAQVRPEETRNKESASKFKYVDMPRGLYILWKHHGFHMDANSAQVRPATLAQDFGQNGHKAKVRERERERERRGKGERERERET